MRPRKFWSDVSVSEAFGFGFRHGFEILGRGVVLLDDEHAQCAYEQAYAGYRHHGILRGEFLRVAYCGQNPSAGQRSYDLRQAY